MTKTILYLHGLRERNSKILEYLKMEFPNYNFLNPPIDPWKPTKTLGEVSKLQEDYIVGFSMGGFFGSLIKTDTPKILINPALCFPEILCTRKHPNSDLTKEYLSLEPYQGVNIKSIFTTEDHKIGLRSLPKYLELYPESSVIYLPGGHEPGKEIIKFLRELIG